MRKFWEFDEEAYKEAIFDDGRSPVYVLVQEGTITPEQAAKACFLSTDVFLEQMTAAGYKVPNMV